MLSSPYPGLIISSIGCGGCEVGSTSRFDHLVDFFRRGEDHGGAVTQHARWHDRRCAAYRPVLARVGHEAQVAFPKGACLAIGGGHARWLARSRGCRVLRGWLGALYYWGERP